MSNLRIFWIIWCTMWAFGWLLCGFIFFPVWIFVPLSLGAILIPIGSAPSSSHRRHRRIRSAGRTGGSRHENRDDRGGVAVALTAWATWACVGHPSSGSAVPLTASA